MKIRQVEHIEHPELEKFIKEYGIYSFAKEIGISGSYMSLMLNGVRPMSPKVYEKCVRFYNNHPNENKTN